MVLRRQSHIGMTSTGFFSLLIENPLLIAYRKPSAHPKFRAHRKLRIIQNSDCSEEPPMSPNKRGNSRSHVHPKRIGDPSSRGWLAVAIIVIASVGLAACSSGTKSSMTTTSKGSATSGSTIVIKNFDFSPSSLSVAPGTTVMVKNEDGVTHTLTSDSGGFNTGNVPANSTGHFTAPSKPGSYPYRCSIHQFMTGTLVVS